MIAPDLQESYVSPASGKVISSYRQRREDMLKTGCVDYEPSLKKECDQRIKCEERQLDKAVDETVEREIDSMPGREREKLGKELESNNIEVVRA